jgi:hypothetical protein
MFFSFAPSFGAAAPGPAIRRTAIALRTMDLNMLELSLKVDRVFAVVACSTNL